MGRSNGESPIVADFSQCLEFCPFDIHRPLQSFPIIWTVMGQDLAVDTAPTSSAAAGPHAERLSNLVSGPRATVDRDTGPSLKVDES